MNNPTTTVSSHTPRTVFASGRIAALVNAGLLPESVLETNAENAVVDYCAHDRGRRNDDCRDDDRRETR